jgi:LysR family nitrogen assimilation transcriptional regulator
LQNLHIGPSMLDLHILESFVRIAELGSLTKAGVGLGVSHTVLSRQVKALEQSLGYRVFHRTGRGVTLTEGGRHLFAGAAELIRRARQITDEAVVLGKAPSGVVTVALPGSVAGVIAGPLFQSAQERYPRISLRFIEALSGVIDELLTLGRIDLGLFYTNTQKVSRDGTPLCVVEMMVVAPAGDRMTASGTIRLRQLRNRPLILPGFPHALRRLIEDSCMQHGFRAHVPFQVDSLSTMVEVVAAGSGYTIAPFDAVAHHVAAKRVEVARITHPALRRVLVMVEPHRGKSTLATRAVAGLIGSHVKECIRAGRWRALPA